MKIQLLLLSVFISFSVWGQDNPEDCFKGDCTLGHSQEYFFNQWKLEENNLSSMTWTDVKSLNPPLHTDKLFLAYYLPGTFFNEFQAAHPEVADENCTKDYVKQVFECPGKPDVSFAEDWAKFQKDEKKLLGVFLSVHDHGKKLAARKGKTPHPQYKTREPLNAVTDNTPVLRNNPTQLILPENSNTPVTSDDLLNMGTPLQLTNLKSNSPDYTWSIVREEPEFQFPNYDQMIFTVSDEGEPVKNPPPVIVIDPNKVPGLTPIVTNPDNDEPLDGKTENGDAPNDCETALRKELLALLADDKKNIVGLQYELTVLKMAREVVGAGHNTLEKLIRANQQKIAGDAEIVSKMKDMYVKHGLAGDEKALEDHAKGAYETSMNKAKSASYFEKSKRFFNEESSAFLLGYRKVTPESDIKDADVSVLWLMSQVSEGVKGKYGAYQAQHNLSNLSTRIVQYTGAVNPDLKTDKNKLETMVARQSEKIKAEFLSVLDKFKSENAVCFNQLFGGAPADQDCNLSLVEEHFSKLLAIASRATDETKLELKSGSAGVIQQKDYKVAFNIKKFVDSPAVKKEEVRNPAGEEVVVEEGAGEVTNG